MSERGRDPRPMGDLLGNVGRDLGLDGAVGTGRVWSRWLEIVGEAIAAHAEPTSLKDGVLRIRTDSPTWATELGYRGAEIARRANAVAGGPLVTEVRVWTGPGAIRPRSGGAPSPTSTPAGESPEGSGAPPNDEPLAALARARAAWARRRSGGAARGSSEGGSRGPGKAV